MGLEQGHQCQGEHECAVKISDQYQKLSASFSLQIEKKGECNYCASEQYSDAQTGQAAENKGAPYNKASDIENGQEWDIGSKLDCCILK